MTLKDQFDVEGVDSTIGYVSRAFQPAREDAALVTILQGLGAIILAKTNLPQSIMVRCLLMLPIIFSDSKTVVRNREVSVGNESRIHTHSDGLDHSPMWGLTINPLNEAFTPGGSTGGEGALLALQGSILGYGTDIGGSIRIPSHMNGVYGLKPTVRSKTLYHLKLMITQVLSATVSGRSCLYRRPGSRTFVGWPHGPEFVNPHYSDEAHDQFTTMDPGPKRCAYRMAAQDL